MQHGNGLSILPSPSLAERTSIRIGGTCIAEICITGSEGYDLIPGLAARFGGRIALLGEGTNILASDNDLPLVLVKQAMTFAPHIILETETEVLLRVHAATRLPALLAQAASLGLSGLEGLSGIPGNTGGAVAMNAGSYGVSVADVLHSVDVFSPLLGYTERPAADFAFSYRSSGLRGHSGWFLVAAATFVLRKDNRDAIRNRMRENYLKKRATQPVTAKSAGCAFTNPPGTSAGKLLDQAGLKGVRLGGMCFSSMHANFLVNEGGGTFEAATDLIELAKDKVKRHSGYDLELEVKLWP